MPTKSPALSTSTSPCGGDAQAERIPAVKKTHTERKIPVERCHKFDYPFRGLIVEKNGKR
jgi:hypothetical protein